MFASGGKNLPARKRSNEVFALKARINRVSVEKSSANSWRTVSIGRFLRFILEKVFFIFREEKMIDSFSGKEQINFDLFYQLERSREKIEHDDPLSVKRPALFSIK